MTVRLLLAISLAYCPALLPKLHAQDEAPVEAAPPAAAAPQNPAQAQFDQVFEQWKGKLKEIRTVQVEYQGASQDEQVELHQRFEQLVDETRAMVPELVAAAEAAYLAAPNAQPDVVNFLMQAVAEKTSNDDYEEALRIAKLLLENEAGKPQLYLMAGVAAFATNDYDAAGKYLEAAEQQGILQPPTENSPEFEQRLLQSAAMYLSMLDQYKQMWAEEQQIRAAEAEADDLPRVKIETSKGPIVVELFENEAPNTVANFVSLVEKDFYDDTIFHRVLPGFMAQGGDPEGTGSGGPGYTIDCECLQKNHRKHFRGTLSMAHAGRDTGGSQFFLTFVPTPHLDGKHTAFGRVIDGFEVLADLNRTEPDRRVKPDKIVEATVLRKRDHEYVPEKN